MALDPTHAWRGLFRCHVCVCVCVVSELSLRREIFGKRPVNYTLASDHAEEYDCLFRIPNCVI